MSASEKPKLAALYQEPTKQTRFPVSEHMYKRDMEDKNYESARVIARELRKQKEGQLRNTWYMDVGRDVKKGHKQGQREVINDLCVSEGLKPYLPQTVHHPLVSAVS